MLAHFKNLHWPRLQTLFRWAFHLGWISLALSLIFYFLGLRLLAEVDQYRPRLEAAISEALTAPVHIERLEGDWRGLHPEVRIRNLRIGHPAAPDTTLLHIPVISVEPSFRQSLRRNGKHGSLETLEISASKRMKSSGAGFLITLTFAAKTRLRRQRLLITLAGTGFALRML